MLLGPTDILYKVVVKIGELTRKWRQPTLEPPLTQRRFNPFDHDDIVQPQTQRRFNPFDHDDIVQPQPPIKEHSTVDNSIIKDLRASDYITPQKYLDGAEIPSYYSFQSNVIPSEDTLHGMFTDWDVDRRLTLPTRTHIRFLVTATDVVHSFAVPSLNVRADALPGRVTRMNTFILREGVFYGQCGEMCGSLHSYMPIVVEAVSPEAYAAHAKKFYVN